jgi:hypothetical protein
MARNDIDARTNFKPFARCEGGKMKLAGSTANGFALRCRLFDSFVDELEMCRRRARVAAIKAHRAWQREKAEILRPRC